MNVLGRIKQCDRYSVIQSLLVLSLLLSPVTGQAESSHLLSLLNKNFGKNILPIGDSLKTLGKKLVKWDILDVIQSDDFKKRKRAAKRVYAPAKIRVRLDKDVEETAFFWVNKKNSSINPSIIYRIVRNPGGFNAPTSQVINFLSPGNSCYSPFTLVMGVKVKNIWYYDTRNIGFIISDCFDY